MGYPEVVLKRGREKWILEGHPWVFRAAVAGHPAAAAPGDVVDVLSRAGRFVCRGHYNPVSSIPVRVLTLNSEDTIDAEFLGSRVAFADEVRKRWIDPHHTSAYRVINGENDSLPGLIVDRYADFLVVQFHTAGMDRRREQVVDVLQQVLAPRGIYERSNVGARNSEGLDTQPVGLLSGEDPPGRIEILENGARFLCDIREGQKTGFFLDQRENRLAVKGLAQGQTVLNCFSYTGGFSVFAALGGAHRVVSVDASEPALTLARENLALNGLDPEHHPCIAANVFEYLKEAEGAGQQYGMVIVDPPAFAKNAASLPRATRAYVRLNRMAMGRLLPGGTLVSASCSSAMDYEGFWGILKQAASRARRNLQIVKSHMVAPDHPAAVAFSEGRYLKCFFGVVR